MGIIGEYLLMPEAFKEVEKESGWRAVEVFVMGVLLAVMFGAVLLIVGIMKVVYRGIR